ncbi:hypothetical protein N0B31_02820 [Salinirubellus salinus]|uniref:Uncharacterized protein n=1 Tax=Salinirubellus salinus TaxID=1364945 RepID=A0A9E7R4U2_9EURY|nr:hypothetical protein [Salinirubellus salinus]UWM55224.1 hypothetical protein N0B31_02820 [Salinirubellus salinus]
MSRADASSTSTSTTLPPAIRTVTDDECCPICGFPLIGQGTAVVDLPVDRLVPDSVRSAFAKGTDTLRSRGWNCPNHSNQLWFVHVVDDAGAAGWTDYVGVPARLEDTPKAWIPVRIDDVPDPILRVIREVRDDV